MVLSYISSAILECQARHRRILDSNKVLRRICQVITRFDLPQIERERERERDGSRMTHDAFARLCALVCTAHMSRTTLDEWCSSAILECKARYRSILNSDRVPRRNPQVITRFDVPQRDGSRMATRRLCSITGAGAYMYRSHVENDTR